MPRPMASAARLVADVMTRSAGISNRLTRNSSNKANSSIRVAVDPASLLATTLASESYISLMVR